MGYIPRASRVFRGKTRLICDTLLLSYCFIVGFLDTGFNEMVTGADPRKAAEILGFSAIGPDHPAQATTPGIFA
jgi:hypothetical protein